MKMTTLERLREIFEGRMEKVARKVGVLPNGIVIEMWPRETKHKVPHVAVTRDGRTAIIPIDPSIFPVEKPFKNPLQEKYIRIAEQWIAMHRFELDDMYKRRLEPNVLRQLF